MQTDNQIRNKQSHAASANSRSRNGEKCAKFTFFIRKKYYLSGK